MKIQVTRELLDGIEDRFYNQTEDTDATIRTDYSGRGMYGAQCVGVVTSRLGDALVFAWAVAITLAEQDLIDDVYFDSEDVFSAVARDIEQDSMGRSAIYYWPMLTLTTEASAVTR